MDTFIQTTDFILFLCFSLMTVYLGVLAIAASLRNDTPYPQAGKRHRFAILVPPGSTSLPLPHYPEELYQVFTYEDLTEAIAALNENDFDGVVVLGETTRIEPAFLEETAFSMPASKPFNSVTSQKTVRPANNTFRL